jgi:putative transposase
MKQVEQHVIEKRHPQFRAIDEMALASKNLWNLANYHVRQAFLFEHTYLDNTAIFHRIKHTDAYKALPAKVANQVLVQVHEAWKAFFEAMEVYRAHPERFRGRPGLPTARAHAETACQRQGTPIHVPPRRLGSRRSAIGG